MISAPSMPAISISRLLIRPLPIRSATAPSDVASIWATVLPRPLRSMSPLILPTLAFVSLTSGNSRFNASDLASSRTCTAAGSFAPSMRIRPARLPPATPRFIRSRSSTPSLSRTRRLMRSSGSFRTWLIRAAR